MIALFIIVCIIIMVIDEAKRMEKFKNNLKED